MLVDNYNYKILTLCNYDNNSLTCNIMCKSIYGYQHLLLRISQGTEKNKEA